MKTKRTEAFRELAKDLEGIDLEVYRSFDKDPLQPIIGEGDPGARLAVFGRDPGRDEVKYQMPFIGAGGRKVRGVLHQHLYGRPMADFAASRAVGSFLFWANTVPYKPLGNKAWSQKVKRRFQPLMADVLVHGWRGRDVLTLGREAFLWFGLPLNREQRRPLEAFWDRADRFENSLPVDLTAADGTVRGLVLHPLPHPSPLNATWYTRFPDLLKGRLESLALSLDHWRLEPQ